VPARARDALADGRVLCLVADRDLTGTGVEVEFLGERTRLPAGPALLALRHDAEILPVGTYTEPHGRHHSIIHPPVPRERQGRLADDIARITQSLARVFEEIIRRAPEQWHLQQPNWPSDRR
jgi:KDO2-lipid IV(A) lauroyltransferase